MLPSGEFLRKVAWDVRFTFLEILSEQFNASMPTLQNTDGDLYEFCTVHFKSNLSPKEVFDKLLPLTLSDNPDPFLSDAKIGKDKQLKKINFTWLKLGNTKRKESENILMGEITINGNQITVQVNSQARAKKIISIMKECLGDDVSYQKTQIQSVEKALSSKKKIEKSNNDEIDIDNSPEAQAILKEITKKHWENWINEPVPALGGLTPKQASKTKAGREKLEALLLDFDSRVA